MKTKTRAYVTAPWLLVVLLLASIALAACGEPTPGDNAPAEISDAQPPQDAKSPQDASAEPDSQPATSGSSRVSIDEPGTSESSELTSQPDATEETTLGSRCVTEIELPYSGSASLMMFEDVDAGCVDPFYDDHAAHTFRLRVTETTYLTVYLLAPAEDMIPFLRLLDSDGAQIANGDNGGWGWNAGMELVLNPGTYEIVATRYPSWTVFAMPISEYALEVRSRSAPNCVHVDSRLPATHEGTLNNDSYCPSEVGGISQFPHNVYQVELDAVTVLRADLRSDDFDSYLMLSDDRGSLLIDDDDSGERYNAAFSIALAPGRYRVAVAAVDEAAGDYVLRLSGDEFAAECSPIDISPSFDRLQNLSVGDCANPLNTEEFAFAKAYRLELDSGQDLQLKAQSDDFKPIVHLISNDHPFTRRALEANDEGVAIGGVSLIPGSYTIVVSEDSPGPQTGDFHLEMAGEPRLDCVIQEGAPSLEVVGTITAHDCNVYLDYPVRGRLWGKKTSLVDLFRIDMKDPGQVNVDFETNVDRSFVGFFDSQGQFTRVDAPIPEGTYWLLVGVQLRELQRGFANYRLSVITTPGVNCVIHDLDMSQVMKTVLTDEHCAIWSGGWNEGTFRGDECNVDRPSTVIYRMDVATAGTLTLDVVGDDVRCLIVMIRTNELRSYWPCSRWRNTYASRPSDDECVHAAVLEEDSYGREIAVSLEPGEYFIQVVSPMTGTLWLEADWRAGE